MRSRISAAGPDERQGLIALAGGDGAHDVDARDDGAVVVGRPADEGEDAARREADDAAVAVEDLLSDLPAEAYPVLDALLVPGQFDKGECASASCARDTPIIVTPFMACLHRCRERS